MTDKTKEALKLALAVLKEWRKGFPDEWTDFDTEAVATIHEALAEQPAIPTVITCPFCSSEHVPGWLHDYNMDRGVYGEQPAIKQDLTPEQPAQQDIPDLIAGAFGVSRGTAYNLMREALSEQPAQQETVAMREVLAKIARFLCVVRVYAQDIKPKHELETDKPLHWKARELQDEVIRLLDTTHPAQPAQQHDPIEEFAYKAITKRGEHCHFGTHAAARIWAGEGGKVETIKLRHLELAEQPAVSAGPITPAMMQGPTPEQKSQMVVAMSKLAEQPAQQQDFSDAYQGAMEDLAIWKKRALEAEELNRKFIADINGQTFMGEPAQPQQEPVGSVHVDTLAMLPSLRPIDGGAKIYPATKAKYDTEYRLIYASPQAQPAQRKPWVGLTDEEIWKHWWNRPEVPDGGDDSMEAEFVAVVRAIEAKLREKNT